MLRVLIAALMIVALPVLAVDYGTFGQATLAGSGVNRFWTFSSTPAVNYYTLSGGLTNGAYVAIWLARGASSLAVSRTNLVNGSTHLLTVGTMPGFDSEGWGFAGAAYLRTDISPNASLSVLVRLSQTSATAANTRMIAETDDAVGGMDLTPNETYSGGTCIGVHGQVVSSCAIVTNGVICLTPAALYTNGVQAATLTANWTSVTPYPLYIGALNEVNVNALPWTGKIGEVRIYNRVLTATEVANETAAVQARP